MIFLHDHCDFWKIPVTLSSCRLLSGLLDFGKGWVLDWLIFISWRSKCFLRPIVLTTRNWLFKYFFIIDALILMPFGWVLDCTIDSKLWTNRAIGSRIFVDRGWSVKSLFWQSKWALLIIHFWFPWTHLSFNAAFQWWLFEVWSESRWTLDMSLVILFLLFY
jgi:hypothetical protein